MDIFGIPVFNDNYIWVIINKVKKTFTCVDPGIAAPVLAYAKKNELTLRNILVTHHHNDHTGGISDLLKHDPTLTVYGPADSRIPSVTSVVAEGNQIDIDDLIFRVISIPGHTSTHICYLELNKQWLFCGDTLFSAGCGRVFDGTIENLHQSIQLLKSLANETKIYCGHEYTLQNLRFAAYVEPDNAKIEAYYLTLKQKTNTCSLPSTLELEKEINPFMRTEMPSVIEFAQKHGVQSVNSLSIFTLLREQKNIFPT